MNFKLTVQRFFRIFYKCKILRIWNLRWRLDSKAAPAAFWSAIVPIHDMRAARSAAREAPPAILVGGKISRKLAMATAHRGDELVLLTYADRKGVSRAAAGRAAAQTAGDGDEGRRRRQDSAPPAVADEATTSGHGDTT